MAVKWVRSLAVALALGGAACAETPTQAPSATAEPFAAAAGEARDRGPGGRILRLREALGLTDAQVARIQTIVNELKAANAPLLEQLRAARGDRRERRQPPDDAQRALIEQVRANSKAAHEKILAVLTAEQRAKLAELRPERPADGRRRPRGDGDGPGRPGAGLLRFADQLGLTQDQVAQLRSIAQELRTQNAPLFEQLRARGTRPGPDDPLLQQIRANTKAATERMLAVLTAEQRAKLEELRAKRRG